MPETNLGKSAVNAYLRLNREMWSHLPPPVRTFPPIRLYGSFVNRLVRWRSARRQYFATYFLRNRPQLQLISRLSDQMAVGSTLRLAVLGCSNGAEVYSTLWTIRSRRPDLNVTSHAVDISKDIVELAEEAVYSLKTPELVAIRDDLDTLYGAAEFLSKRVSEATDDKFQIRVFAGNEIVPAFQVLDAVQNNTVELGQTAPRTGPSGRAVWPNSTEGGVRGGRGP